MALSISFIGKVWRKSGKRLVRLPEEYAGLFRHGQRVEVEIVVGPDRYRFEGVVKRYRSGVYVKLPPQAEALRGEWVRVRVYG